MAVGPCGRELQEQRVKLVEDYSRHVTFLLEMLYRAGEVTEEDVSLVRGGGRLGERDRMRMLLDVLQGRGEEACRAFLLLLPTVTAMPAGTHPPKDAAHHGQCTQDDMQELLKKHKGILGRQHSLTDYLNIRGGASECREGGTFTEITLSQRVGYTVPLQYQHETTEVGDAFRIVGLEGGRHEKMCEFREVCQSLLSARGEGVTLLSGVAGSGKTTVVRRLVREWATDTDSQKVIFSLTFRELNLISTPQSLHKLLSVHYSHLRPILDHILASDPAKILIILDGLDEFCLPLDFARTPKCSDPELAQSVGEMVVNLIKGNLLPGVSLLLTSRPHAISKVPPQQVTVLYSVLGFSRAQQQQYFGRSCGAPEAAAAVWRYVSSHQPLLRMCHIPAFCWIVATALRGCTSFLGEDAAALSGGYPPVEPAGVSALKDTPSQTPPGTNALLITAGAAGNLDKPATVTEIYCCFLKAVLVFHGEGREGGSQVSRLQDAPRVLRETRPLLRDLGALAFKGLLERRFVFSSDDLGVFSLDCRELSQAFLVEILQEDRVSLTYEKSFHFIHTSVQEFLAALYYVLEALSGSDPFSGLKPAAMLLPPALRKALAATTRRLLGQRRLLLRHVKKAFHWSEHHQSGHLDLFCRFVSGLLVPRTRLILEGLFPKEPRRPLFRSHAHRALPPTPHFLLCLLQSQLQCKGLSPERQVNACYCLYEAQDPGLSRRMQGWLQLLAQQAQAFPPEQAERDWSELAFLLQLNPGLPELSLEAQGLDAQGLRRLLPVLPLFSTLRLGQNPLGPEGAAVLSSALQSPDCRIERLWVVATGLGCEGLKVLAQALKQNSTVVDLRMAINGIGDVGAAHLAELLRANRTLKDIRLRDNQVTDKGAELLMAALIENTTLEFLWMYDNKVSKEGVKKLKEFAKSRPGLDIKVCV
ncbi:NLR family CARD domain-containing protein 3 [Megalops cyprinoides]|uniref:NLR family CARD domain-containing protein 3 n=1 Tax=Megalops cyprinoides TaxID=118141 RepID=UPI001864F1C9|nr:NLR family CARD domain-containing protein 3 [Megalops cyprinoides]